jgi:hypothetical protein
MNPTKTLETISKLQCPWPTDIFPISVEQYVERVPDPQDRTAISGLLMRMGWEHAIQSVKDAIAQSDE